MFRNWIVRAVIVMIFGVFEVDGGQIWGSFWQALPPLFYWWIIVQYTSFNRLAKFQIFFFVVVFKLKTSFFFCFATYGNKLVFFGWQNHLHNFYFDREMLVSISFNSNDLFFDPQPSSESSLWREIIDSFGVCGVWCQLFLASILTNNSREWKYVCLLANTTPNIIQYIRELSNVKTSLNIQSYEDFLSEFRAFYGKIIQILEYYVECAFSFPKKEKILPVAQNMVVSVQKLLFTAVKANDIVTSQYS